MRSQTLANNAKREKESTVGRQRVRGERSNGLLLLQTYTYTYIHITPAFTANTVHQKPEITCLKPHHNRTAPANKLSNAAVKKGREEERWAEAEEETLTYVKQVGLVSLAEKSLCWHVLQLLPRDTAS